MHTFIVHVWCWIVLSIVLEMTASGIFLPKEGNLLFILILPIVDHKGFASS